MFDDIAKKRRNWEALIGDLGARNMESGLALLVWTLLSRMHTRLGGDLNQLVEYVANNAAAWTFPEIENEKPEDRERARADWERHVATLDTAILSLIGENDIPDEDIEAALDDILQSSLWHRRLLRQDEPVRQVLKVGLVSRSRLIWSQSTAARRRGYFLAGVGLTTGHALDAIAEDANLLLVQANAAILDGDGDAAIAAITGLAERVFEFYPFSPDPWPANWRDILRAWLSGNLSPPLPQVKNPKPSSSSRAAWCIVFLGLWKPCACERPRMVIWLAFLASPSKTMRLVLLFLLWRQGL